MNDLCPCLGYSPWFSPSERNVGSFPEQQLAINTNVSRKTLQRSVLRQTVTKRIIDIKVNLKSPFIWVRLACWYSYRGNLWRNYTTFFEIRDISIAIQTFWQFMRVENSIPTTELGFSTPSLLIWEPISLQLRTKMIETRSFNLAIANHVPVFTI